jgi:cobalamin biosynthesis Mg chelatase CobN
MQRDTQAVKESGSSPVLAIVVVLVVVVLVVLVLRLRNR